MAKQIIDSPSPSPSESESDSSDDDVPIASLWSTAATSRSSRAAIQAKTQAKPKAEAKVKTDTKVKPEVKPKGSGIGLSDSEDELPLSTLATIDKSMNKDTKVKKEEPKVKKEEPKVKKEPRGSAAKKEKKRPSEENLKKESSKRAKPIDKQKVLTEELYNTQKGKLVQQLLCRWWYAVEWPKEDSMKQPSQEDLKAMQELDGYKGLYIRVKGDDMGKIVDTRNPVGKPSFLHFISLPSAEVIKLLIRAYEKQMEALIEHEGEDAPMLKQLKSAHSQASKVSADRADKGFAKVMTKSHPLYKRLKDIQAQYEATG